MEIISVIRGDDPNDPWRLSPSTKGMIPLRPSRCTDACEAKKNGGDPRNRPRIGDDAPYHVTHLLLGDLDVEVGKHLGEANDATQRRADLTGHQLDKLRLHP